MTDDMNGALRCTMVFLSKARTMLGMDEAEAAEFAYNAQADGKKLRECDYRKYPILSRWDPAKGEFAYFYGGCCAVISAEGVAIQLYEDPRLKKKPQSACKHSRPKRKISEKWEDPFSYDE